MKLRKYYPTIVLSDIHLFGMGISHYLNSGDWVESLTAFVENEQGEWNIVFYNKEGYTADEMQPSCLHYAEVI